MNINLPITLIILTKNEELNISNILKNTNNFFNQTIIVDSFSNDKTLEICKNFNTDIYTNNFMNQGIQFNWALKNCKINNAWIMRLDADEIMEESLKKEISELVINQKLDNYDGYFINRKLIWDNKWIKYGGIYPHFILRLFKIDKGHSEEITEEHIIVDGFTSNLKNRIIEHNLKNDICFFTEKHIITGMGEVNEYLQNQTKILKYDSKYLYKSSVRRKMKVYYYKFPIYLRAFIYFIYRYIFLLGFLDGKAGFSFHFFQSFWYRMYIDKLITEKKSND